MPENAGTHNRSVFVVKVGSSSLTDRAGTLNEATISAIAAQLARVVAELDGRAVVVTSGAVAAGLTILPLGERSSGARGASTAVDPPASLADGQVDDGATPEIERSSRAAIGQIKLMNTYADSFRTHGLVAAQLLVTGNELDNSEAFESIRETLLRLLSVETSAGGGIVVPVVNANDVVNSQINENDDLAARVAVMCRATKLIILTDIDGVFAAHPRKHPNAEIVRRITNVEAALDYVVDDGDSLGSGGMRSKLLAASSAANGGVDTVIASATAPDVIVRLANGESLGTHVVAKHAPLPDKELFIGAIARPKGMVLTHREAVRALARRPSSLLSVGIAGVRAHGQTTEFEAGEVVSLCGPEWYEFGRGVVAVSSLTLRHIASLSADALSGMVSVSEATIAQARSDLWDAVTHASDQFRALVDAMLERDAINGDVRSPSSAVTAAKELREDVIDRFPGCAASLEAMDDAAYEDAVEEHCRRQRRLEKLGVEAQAEHAVAARLEAKMSSTKSHIGEHEALVLAPLARNLLGIQTEEVSVTTVARALHGSRRREGISSHEAFLIAAVLLKGEQPESDSADFHTLRRFIQAGAEHRSVVRREGESLLRTSGGNAPARTAFAPVVRRDRMVIYPTELDALVERIETRGRAGSR